MSKFYLVKTNKQGIEGEIIRKEHLNKENAIIINSFSKGYNNILLPKYFSKNKKLLKKHNLDYRLGVFETKCLEILIENEKNKYNFFFINMSGFSFDSISDIKKILFEENNYKNKIFYIVDYNSDYKYFDYIIEKF